MNRMLRITLPLAAGVALAAAAGCAKRGGKPFQMPPGVVRTAPAVSRDCPVVLSAFGHTVDRASVDVVPQVSGFLRHTFIRDGAVVTNGQPLFEIDPSDYAIRVRQAEAAVAADRANVALARSKVERNRPLLAKALVAKQDFETLQAAADAAAAQTQADAAALDAARLALSRCTVTAAVAGVCSLRQVDDGNLVTAGLTRLINIRNYDPLYVDFAVSEQELALIRQALRDPPVRMTVTPRGDTNSYEGTLDFMDNAVSSQTGTISLRGQVPNPDLRLWANQFVEVRVVASVVRDAVMVPEGAVQYGKEGSYLFAVSPTNTAELRLVRTGVRDNDWIQILSGVRAGERVVVLGQLMLGPGTPVLDLSRMPPGAPPAGGGSTSRPAAGKGGAASAWQRPREHLS